jgi:LysR family transcriptional regulator, transcriptional activator for dmlA
MLDDLTELRTFERILALGSLSAAARNLGVGLAVVSKRLSTLERRAGVRLVNRTTRSLSPTEEGRALFAHVERMLDELATAEAQLSSGAEEPHGVLRVSSPISFGRIHLVRFAADLIEKYPHLDIELKLDDRIVDLIDERVDIAIRIGAPRDSSAIMRRIVDNARVLVASPDYLKKFGLPRMPADLSSHRLLRYDANVAPWRLEGPNGATAEIETRCRLHADNGDAVLDWALMGQGITLKSYVDVCRELETGRLERVLPDWQSPPAPVYALLPSSRHMATKTRVFLDSMMARLEELPKPKPNSPRPRGSRTL